MRKQKKAVVFCPCGQVDSNGNWSLPVIDLAGFIRELVARDFATFTFVKATCPECFKGEQQ